MSVSPWIDPESVVPFPYQFVAIYHDGNNYNENSEDPGDKQHLILTYKESNNDHGLYLSYKIHGEEYDSDNGMPGPEETLQGYYKIHRIRYGTMVDRQYEWDDRYITIEFKTVDNPDTINEFSFFKRLYDGFGTDYFAIQTINGVTQRIQIGSEIYHYFSNFLLEIIPDAIVYLPPAPVPPVPAPVPPVPAPVPAGVTSNAQNEPYEPFEPLASELVGGPGATGGGSAAAPSGGAGFSRRNRKSRRKARMSRKSRKSNTRRRR